MIFLPVVPADMITSTTTSMHFLQCMLGRLPCTVLTIVKLKKAETGNYGKHGHSDLVV